MSGQQLGAVGSIVVVLLIVLVIVLRFIRRDPLLRSVRLGVFLERERFDEHDVERGFDEDETIERRYE